jgi:hypothetical protein
VAHPVLTFQRPTQGESWRMTFSVHVSAISRVLDAELQRVAAEGEMLVANKG